MRGGTDAPQSPEAWEVEVLALFRASFVSPPALIDDGERAGQYRASGDQLAVDAKGVSRISVPDYAVELLDQLGQKEAFRRRITVAY
jgi:uncharacterized protein